MRLSRYDMRPDSALGCHGHRQFNVLVLPSAPVLFDGGLLLCCPLPVGASLTVASDHGSLGWRVHDTATTLNNKVEANTKRTLLSAFVCSVFEGSCREIFMVSENHSLPK